MTTSNRLGRCPIKGCAWRWRDGRDRACPDTWHAVQAALAEGRPLSPGELEAARADELVKPQARPASGAGPKAMSLGRLMDQGLSAKDVGQQPDPGPEEAVP